MTAIVHRLGVLMVGLLIVCAALSAAAKPETLSDLCESSWPVDAQMREHCQKTQMAALSDYIRLTAKLGDAGRIIVDPCEDAWLPDFKMALHCVQTQLDATIEFTALREAAGDLPAENAVLDLCQERWGADYKMALHCAKAQDEALSRLAR